jgi:hypothetical protein
MDRFTQVIEEYILEYVDPLLRTTWSVFEGLSSSCTHQTARSCNENGNARSLWIVFQAQNRILLRNKQRIWYSNHFQWHGDKVGFAQAKA